MVSVLFVGQLHFRVVVTKSVETSAWRPPRRGGAHLGHVFRGQAPHIHDTITDSITSVPVRY